MSCVTSWWFQPIWKIWIRQIGSFLQQKGENKKYLKPPATVLPKCSVIVKWDSSSSFRWQTPSFANLLKSMDGSQRIYGRHFYRFKGYLSPRFPWNIQGPISLTKPTIWGPLKKPVCFGQTRASSWPPVQSSLLARTWPEAETEKNGLTRGHDFSSSWWFQPIWICLVVEPTPLKNMIVNIWESSPI